MGKLAACPTVNPASWRLLGIDELRFISIGLFGRFLISHSGNVPVTAGAPAAAHESCNLLSIGP
jgi:hypothetical protein